MTIFKRHHKEKRYNRILLWFINHLRACIYGFSELVHAPLASLMTIMVIGVAIALPAGFYLLLQNFQSLSKPWNGNPTISLYLKQGSSDAQIKQTLAALQNRSDIRQIHYISPTQALNEFKKMTPFSDVVNTLQTNPLPPALIITPTANNDPETLKQTLQSVKTLPNVDVAELDMSWVQRLHDIITLGKRITVALVILFGIGVILIVGNTIRLTTQTHRQEINILKLVGATHAFIRRPFLYRGFWYGCLSGCVAWLLVSLMLWWLDAPAKHLAESYGNAFIMRGLSPRAGLAIITSSILMGLIGSWIAMRKYLISPENP